MVLPSDHLVCAVNVLNPETWHQLLHVHSGGKVVSPLSQLRLYRLQGLVDDSETRPGGGFPVPAQFHQFVHRLGSVVWKLQHVPFLDELDYFLVSHAVVGLQSEGEDLPQTHTVRPHVRLHCVLVVQDRL